MPRQSAESFLQLPCHALRPRAMREWYLLVAAVLPGVRFRKGGRSAPIPVATVIREPRAVRLGLERQ